MDLPPGQFDNISSMKNFFPLLILVTFVLYSCTGDNNTISEKPLTSQDSIKLQNKVYAKGILSLAREKNISKLLCQGWIMDDDIDVIKDNGEAYGNIPYRCLYLFDDATYTRNVRNWMEHGSWKYDEAQ